MGGKTSQFDEARVVERNPYLQLGSVYGLSVLRDLQTKSASASIDFMPDDGEFRLRPGGANEEAILDTAERVPYGPGTVLEPGAAWRVPSTLTGSQVFEQGIADDSNGFLKRLDKNGLHFVARKNDSEKVETWGEWDNHGRIVRGDDRVIPANGYIWLDPFSWYGFGPWESGLQESADPGGDDFVRMLHSYKPRGGTSLATPHLPLRARVATGTGDASFDAFVAGRQVSILGRFLPPTRATAVSRDAVTVGAVVGSTWTGLAAVRRAADAAYAITRFAEADVLATRNIEIAIVLNPTIPNPGNWEAVLDGTESKLEQNIDPGDIDLSTAEWVTKRRIAGGGGQGSNTVSGGGPRPLVDVPLIENKPFAIAARRTTSEDSDVEVTFIWDEWF